MATGIQTDYSISRAEKAPEALYLAENELIQESTLEQLSFFAVVGLIFFFPFFFGGVHPTTYLTVMIGIFTLTGAMLLTAKMSVLLRSKDNLTRLVIATFVVSGVYVLFQPLLLPSEGMHPVVTFPDGARWDTALETFRWFAFSTALFVLCRSVLKLKSDSYRLILRAVMWSGVFVSLTGLAHWFYDNGKLFWTFSPEWVFISKRARWPFVNTDHFGHYLLLCLFPAVALLQESLSALLARIRKISEREKKWISVAFLDKKCQQALLHLTLPFFAALVSLLGILASLSRAAWLGMLAGLLVMLIMRLGMKRQEPASQRLQAQELKSRRRRSKQSVGAGGLLKKVFQSRKFRKALPFIGLGILTLFLLNEQGSDLVADRIEFGLLYSKDDIRFQMYSDTFPMLKEHLWYGVGPGGWVSQYSRYMDPLLAGLNHSYLHSDPIQFLVEFGILGALPLVLLVTSLLAAVVVTARKNLSPNMRLTLSGIVSALTAFAVAVSFDFSLRIPAILAQVIVLVAILCEILDQAADSAGSDSRTNAP